MESSSSEPTVLKLQRRAGNAPLARRSLGILGVVALSALAGGLLGVPVLWIVAVLGPLVGIALWMARASRPRFDTVGRGRVNGVDLAPDAEVVLRGWGDGPVALEVDGLDDPIQSWSSDALSDARRGAEAVAAALDRPLVVLVSERPEDDDAQATRWARRLAGRRRHSALALYPEIGTAEPLEPQGVEQDVDRLRIVFPEVEVELTNGQVRVLSPPGSTSAGRTCARHRVVDVLVGPFQLPPHPDTVASIRKPVRYGERFGMQVFLVTLDGVFPLVQSMIPRGVTSQSRKRELGRLVWIAEAIRDWIPEEPTLAGVPDALSRLRSGGVGSVRQVDG